MKTLLHICLLAVFVGMGASLECEICEADRHSCNGSMKTCPPGYDSCGIILMESTGIKLKAIRKICTPSISCSAGTNIINMGQNGTILSQLFCCMGDKCTRSNSTFPPISTKPNGKVCPACYSVHQFNCEEEEEIQCTGDQDHCVQVSGSTNRGELAVKTVIKGCSNKAACYDMHEQSSSFSGIKKVSSMSCTPAPSKAPKGSWVVPGLFGLLLPGLAGLLVMTVIL